MTERRPGLLTVPIAACLAACAAPERDCAADLWYLGSADRVRVVGDFNGWNSEHHPMVEVEPGAFHLRIEPPAGEYRYMFEVDGEWIRDPFAPLMSFEDPVGEELSLLRVPSCEEPALEVADARATAEGSLRVEAGFLRATGGPRLDAGSATAWLWDGTELEVEAEPGSGSLRVQAEGLPRGKHSIWLQAADRSGQLAEARASVWVEEEPFLWEDALIYQVVVDRFAGPEGEPLAPEGWDPQDIAQRFGGTWSGVTARMRAGYFEALGVNTLWLSPINRNPSGLWPGADGREYSSYHGYWPVSSTEVEPSFGAEADLEELIEEAHARGIRVLIDVVPNHVHRDHPYYQEHAGWFHAGTDCICGSYECPWESDIESCWFTEYLPDFDWGVPGVPDRVVDDMLYWAERFDLDGYRVDAVPMLPRAAVRLLVHRAGQELESGGQRFYTLGETFTGPTGLDDIRANLGPFGLDGQFEFPMLWTLRDFAAGWADAESLDAAVRESEAEWQGSGSVMAPIVGNHDMDRLLSVVAGQYTGDPWEDPPPQPGERAAYERSLLAQVVALTLPGAPVIYYGDELGLAGAADPDCRRPLPGEEQLSADQAWLLERVRRVGQARRCVAALRRGDRQTLGVQSSAYAYLRDVGDGAPALVALNGGDELVAMELRLPAAALAAGSGLIDIIEGSEGLRPESSGRIELSLPPRSARVFIADSSACDLGEAP